MKDEKIYLNVTNEIYVFKKQLLILIGIAWICVMFILIITGIDSTQTTVFAGYGLIAIATIVLAIIVY